MNQLAYAGLKFRAHSPKQTHSYPTGTHCSFRHVVPGQHFRGGTPQPGWHAPSVQNWPNSHGAPPPHGGRQRPPFVHAVPCGHGAPIDPQKGWHTPATHPCFGGHAGLPAPHAAAAGVAEEPEAAAEGAPERVKYATTIITARAARAIEIVAAVWRRTPGGPEPPGNSASGWDIGDRYLVGAQNARPRV